MTQKPRNPTAITALHQKETASKRRSIINELNFTYKRLLRLLPGIIKHVDPDPVGVVLTEQDRADRAIAQGLEHVAKELGQPPEPCVCADADAMVEGLYHADRSAPTREARGPATILALKALRAFLIRLWGRLIATFAHEERSRPLSKVMALQEREGELHRNLVTLGNQVEAADRPGS
ncbi:MAG: hypothetical protein ABI432_06920 [Flavobacteriales bacterium]